MATIIDMPKLSDTMTVGTLVTWLKAVGDPVVTGDMIAEIETDKATMELESFDDGVLLAIYASEGDQVSIGAPICAIGEAGEEAPARPSDESHPEPGKGAEPEDSRPAAEETEVTATVDQDPEKSIPPAGEAPPPSETPPEKQSGERLRISPLARKIAADHGIELTSISGTGPGGRIVKADVLAAVAGGPPAPTTTDAPFLPSTTAAISEGREVAQDSRIQVSNIRAIIAQRLIESKTQIPHFYLETEIDAGPLSKMRADLNNHFESAAAGGAPTRLSVNDFVLKASVEALRQVPEINRSWEGDHIRQHGAVHLAFAVAIEDGLVTPVIKDAHARSLVEISAMARDLATRARNKKLPPAEMSGSTLTVTNLGMFGVTGFYGIINPPNAAILSVGATVKKPVVDEHDRIAVGLRMAIGLSGDHRTIDGVAGARFLDALKEVLEAPARLLV
jgi:pyruvate dehydrogenase E2 component (dihydrolipoamide acetyltransferase)